MHSQMCYLLVVAILILERKQHSEGFGSETGAAHASLTMRERPIQDSHHLLLVRRNFITMGLAKLLLRVMTGTTLFASLLSERTDLHQCPQHPLQAIQLILMSKVFIIMLAVGTVSIKKVKATTTSKRNWILRNVD